MTGIAHRKLLFVVGCPRSGTTWLQLLLAQHPAVATHNETFLFAYLDRMRERWRIDSAHPPQHRKIGLIHLLSNEEFDGLCRDFASRALGKIAESRPGAEVVLEKTPDHIMHWETILALFPDAYFLHVVRDPRSVVASMLAASEVPWGIWAPKTVAAATMKWREAIEAGWRLAAKVTRYREIRYEAVTADGPGEMRQILSWLGLSFAPEFPEQAVAACRIENLQGDSPPASAPWALSREPAGFFRRGEADGWRTDLTGAQVRHVEYLVGDLMCQLDYAPVSPGFKTKPLDLRARELVGSIRWRLQRWLA